MWMVKCCAGSCAAQLLVVEVVYLIVRRRGELLSVVCGIGGRLWSLLGVIIEGCVVWDVCDVALSVWLSLG